MNNKEKAEAYVRQQLPELRGWTRGCLVKFPKGNPMIVDLLKSRTDGKHDLYASSLRDGEPLEMTGLQTKDVEELVVIGHPIQLQHWLKVLTMHAEIVANDYPDWELHVKCHNEHKPTRIVLFSLKNGQPLNDEDYKTFNDIVGI